MSGAVFVVAGPGGAQRGPVAAMVSTAGWASAARRELGDAWIVTPRGVSDPASVRDRAIPDAPTYVRGRELRGHLPTPLKTGLKDVRERRRGRRFRVGAQGPWSGSDLDFVWQRHELFQTAGIRLAHELGVPSVLFVPATIVWEAERWGTRRPGWGPVLERLGERPALRSADLVACGSQEVAREAQRLGVDPDRVLVTPTGVDLDLFGANVDRLRIRAELGLQDRFVVGWAGSFRRFHAVETVVAAAAGMERTSLLLVGDGVERPRVQQMAREAGVHVVAPGMVPHHELARHLTAMDVGVVLARKDQPFHYSPLKLAEYLASGVPVVAPDVGQLARRLHDGRDAILVSPGDVEALRQALRRLDDDVELRRSLADNGRELARRDFSWDVQVRRVTEALEAGPGQRGRTRRRWAGSHQRG